MTPVETGLIGIAILLVMLFLRIPIGVAMISVGLGGYAALNGVGNTLNYIKTATYWRFSTYDLSVIPMFLLMGEFAAGAGLSRSLFRAAAAMVGHRKGGIAISVIAACAAFGAICGSSLATAATMTRVSLPEFSRYKYSPALATGSLAAGGTLGILIPPSIALVIYAIIVEGNIVSMFAAALIPGLLAACGYVVATRVYVWLNPEAGPAGERIGGRERVLALIETWPIALIFFLVIGGIYLGWFTPTEAAAIGAFGTGAVAVWRGGMRWEGFIEAVLRTASATAMIFLIVLGAEFLNSFFALTRISMEAADWITTSSLSPFMVVAVIMVIYLILGCVMDSLSMILLTLPIFWPILSTMDFGMDPEHMKMWFGVLVLVVVEFGLITPPVGLNIAIIGSMAPHIATRDIYRGVVPFIVSDIVRIALLFFFPIISLALPLLLGAR
ncbi:TRAP transporter large permease [Pseudolabrys taiwanensis]|uniref:TRAP transporter large permease protein n=1 Tax=Pseudolabrys taiwanensis TaxID=331696 RepID=A0A346A1U1_9HYPH|nr:TRAP transporter large permease [Pseudolabrys taiwanensis]AXK83138.1 TRAP transporter large permease [Pseudolabrys taiwanensis]